MKFLKKNYERVMLFGIFLTSPLFVGAQAKSHIATNATSLVKSIHELITKQLIPLMILLALIYVIYAVVEFIRENEDTKARQEKQQKIFWGVIGLFVLISVWALVALVANSFSLFAGGKLAG